jgi:hypothetical protein
MSYPPILKCNACGEQIIKTELGGINHTCSKVCIVCGHSACPLCGDWCDYLTEDLDLCCDGECTYPENELDHD